MHTRQLTLDRRDPSVLRGTRGANHSHSHTSHAPSPQYYPQRMPRRLIVDMAPTKWLSSKFQEVPITVGLTQSP